MSGKIKYYLLFLILALLFQGCSSNVSKKTARQAESPSDSKGQIAPGSRPLTAAEKGIYQQGVENLRKKEILEANKILLGLANKGIADSGLSANLALSYYHLADYPLAKQHVDMALSLAAHSAEAQNLAGLIAIEQNKHKDAETYFKKALQLNNQFANAHFNIALLYDIYYQNIQGAYDHYLQYLNLVGYKDQQTMDWVEQLKYSLER